MLMADPRNPLPRRLRLATVDRSDAGRPALLLRATRWSLSILRLTLIALALPLSACSSVLTDTRSAAMDGVPAHWQSAEALDTTDAAGTAAPPTDLAAWWLRFDDAALSDWTRRAREGNPRALVAEAAWRQAVAQRDVAAAARWPSLGGDASASRSTRGDGPGEERVQLGLSARWVPDVFGGAGLALAAADAVVRVRRASWGDVQVQLAAEAALAYIDLRVQQLRLALARDTLASQRQTLQITDWRQQAGLVSALEVEQARAAAAQTEALLPTLRTAIAQRRHALALLAGEPYIGTDADGAAEIEPGSVPTAPASLALEIPAETLRQRADVRAAELEVAAAFARVGQAEAQRWPSFALSGSIGLNALTLGALGDTASRVSSLLAGVSLPLVDGGARRAQVRVQQAALDQARAQHRATVLGALREVEDALVALQGDRGRLAALRRAALSADRAARLAQQRFSGGLVDFQTVLQTQRTAYSAQDAVLGARADLARDHVQLYRALGGGWQDAPVLVSKAADR